jgi:hypothetical protein
MRARALALAYVAIWAIGCESEHTDVRVADDGGADAPPACPTVAPGGTANGPCTSLGQVCTYPCRMNVRVVAECRLSKEAKPIWVSHGEACSGDT